MVEHLNGLWEGSPIVGGLTADALGAFLHDMGLAAAVPVYDGPDLPDDPGAMLVITMLPGAGFLMEQALDAPAFQVRTVGPQGNPEAASALAKAVDGAFTAEVWPRTLMDPETGESRRVVIVHRSGGGPAQDRVDNAQRTHWVCTYVAEIAVPIGE